MNHLDDLTELVNYRLFNCYNRVDYTGLTVLYIPAIRLEIRIHIVDPGGLRQLHILQFLLLFPWQQYATPSSRTSILSKGFVDAHHSRQNTTFEEWSPTVLKRLTSVLNNFKKQTDTGSDFKRIINANGHIRVLNNEIERSAKADH